MFPTEYDLDTPLGEAGPALRGLLVKLAETFAANRERPACDADTTLRDWLESGLYTSDTSVTVQHFS